MDKTVFLSDVIAVRSRFLRSVHIERDYGDSPDGYHLTESAYQVLKVVDSALAHPVDRAMTLVGPHGAGKSAFCVHLAHILERRRAPLPLEALERIDPALANRYQDAGRRLIPILLVGSRRSLASALVSGLAHSLERGGYGRLLERLRAEAAGIFDSPAPLSRQVADLYQRAACLAEMEGAKGLLLIVDELGKFLEHAALHPKEGDIFTLQEMAEAAARSGGTPLLMLTVLHQNAEAYAQKLGRTYQAEWAKVGERFRQVAFFPSDAERMDMVGLALEQRHGFRLNGKAAELSRLCVEQGLWHAGLRDRFSAMAHAAYPLHPLSLLALPALFRKTGQSHRSLFSFLSGEEPHAFGRFLRETPMDDANPPFYMPDAVFDYAAEALLGGWSAPGISRLWAEAVDTVERALNLSEGARRTLKVIALLGILKDPRLAASPRTLEIALTGCDGARHDIGTALAELKRRRLIAYSRTTDTYRLWEGGDVDVEAELAQARSGLPAGIALHVATSLCPPPRLIARRHSYETGAVRVVTAHPCGLQGLRAVLDEKMPPLTVLFCLTATPEEADHAEELARQVDRPQLLIAIALETDALREAATEIAAAHRVEKETPALVTDRAARRELAARRQEAETAFRQEWKRLFGPQKENGGETSWFYRGQRIEIYRTRDFSEQLSRMADETYPHAPRLRNELINRHSLSSQAVAGRRNLIESMLTQAGVYRLGLHGFPPEVSMYECLLRATGLHREITSDQWAFGPPPEATSDATRLRPCWEALERWLFGEPPEPRPVTELFAALSAPPYGLTNGVLPILLCAFLLACPDETTLYREGTFVPEPTVADWEVLMRRPELFAVAGSRVSGEREAVVRRLANGLQCKPAVVPVVRALLRMVRGLPEHAWKTRRLPENVLAMRDAFERARSPERLLFQELPSALGVTVLAQQEIHGGNVEEFFDALNAALRAWNQATPSMMAAAQSALLQACGIVTGEEGWKQLRERAAALEQHVSDPTLLPFVRRAAQPGDDRTVLESVLALVANRPPRTWTDGDADRFPAQARVIGALFQRANVEENPVAAPALLPEEETACREVTRQVRELFSGRVPQHVLRAALTALLREMDRTQETTSDERA